MTEEDFKAMMNGNYTEQVMSDEERAAYESAENTDETVGENANYDVIGGSDEIGDEIAEPNKDKEAESNREDTTATDKTVEASGTENEVAQDTVGETKAGDSVDGDARPAEVDGDSKEKLDDEPNGTDGEPDYKQRYEELMSKFEEADAFRKTVTGDFKANGKTVSGITDPNKIVKNLQMSVGLTRKLDGYKAVKPLVDPLEKRGLLQDTAKFDMLMKLADGDKEALKQYMKDNSIDPVDIDLDEGINYDPTSTVSTAEQLRFQDMYDVASTYGVEDKFADVVLKEWDPKSAAAILDSENGTVMAQQLSEQISNGLYDGVMSIAENMKITEQGFSSLSSLDQYQEASKVYNARMAAQRESSNVGSSEPIANTAANLEPNVEAASATTTADTAAEIEARIRAKVEAEVKAEVQAKIAAEAKEKEIEKQRDEAVRASQVGGTANSQVNADSIPKNPDDFRKYWKTLMSK